MTQNTAAIDILNQLGHNCYVEGGIWTLTILVLGLIIGGTIMYFQGKWCCTK